MTPRNESNAPRELEDARCKGYIQGQTNGRETVLREVLAQLRSQPQTIVIGRDLSGMAVHGTSWAAAAADFIERRFSKTLAER